MVQGIMELLFDAAYLIFAFVVGVYLIVKGNGKYFKLFGVMAVVLSSGDAFHLVPRVYSLLTTGLEANAFALGLGKLITSVTMTAFLCHTVFHSGIRMAPRRQGQAREQDCGFCACPRAHRTLRTSPERLVLGRGLPPLGNTPQHTVRNPRHTDNRDMLPRRAQARRQKLCVHGRHGHTLVCVLHPRRAFRVRGAHDRNADDTKDPRLCGRCRGGAVQIPQGEEVPVRAG